MPESAIVCIVENKNVPAGGTRIGAISRAQIGGAQTGMGPTRVSLGFNVVTESAFDHQRSSGTVAGSALEPQTEIEAAVFRRLVAHFRGRTDVQNIDIMNLAGFCRNCLSRWYEEEALERGVKVDRGRARELVYGMPYEQWKSLHQTAATTEQRSLYEAVRVEEATK